MEENLQDLSVSTADVSVKPKKKINKKILVTVLCILLVLLLCYRIILRAVWNSYYEKYYEKFMNTCNYEVLEIDERSSWGYMEYDKDGFKSVIEFHKPKKDKFTFAVGFVNDMDRLGDETYWTIDRDNGKYYPELTASIHADGSIDYTGCIYFDDTYTICDFGIDKDGKIYYSDKDLIDKSDEVTAVGVHFEDKIYELKDIIENDLLKGVI